ncbi:serine hydrolase domain-containing protein [Acidobacteriota bacterium]
MLKKNLTAVLICVFVSTFMFAQQPGEISYKDTSVMPEGKIGERIQSLIDTINSGDSNRIKRFIQEECTGRFKNMSLEDHLNAFTSFLHETGGIEFHSIRTYDPPRTGVKIVILKDKNFEAWRAFTLRLSEDENHLITGMEFGNARTPSNVKEEPLSEDDFLAETKNMMNRLNENEMFSGTLLIAKGSDVLFSFAAGEASKRYHVPINIDTKFNLGSMNKMFTSLTIMNLLEKEQLSLEDTIDKFVDETWLPKETTSKITIHNLLTHTSGLGSYFNSVYMRSSKQLFRKLDDYKPLIKVEKLSFEPGKRYQYSNTGMFLLGVVIESITGEDYFETIRKVIYEPSGMKDSDCYEMDYPVENLAIGYSPDKSSEWGWQNNYYKHVIKGGPAGGGFSTVGDLHRFALALLSGKLVSEASLEKMWTDHFNAGYGYGFGIQEGTNGKVVGHSGGFSGINSNLDIFLDRGYIIAVMSNFDNGASPIANRINALLARVIKE